MSLKVKINGNMAVVESPLNFAELQKLCKGKKFVSVKNDKGEVLYTVETGKRGEAKAFGATFTYANADGKACFNFGPEEAGSADGKLTKEQIYDALGAGIAAFNQYEEQAVAAMAEAKAAHDRIMENITVD